MDAVGPYFPIDMTQDCLILLSLSKKRPKNNLLRRVACSRRGSSMQIRKTQFFLDTLYLFALAVCSVPTLIFLFLFDHRVS